MTVRRVVIDHVDLLVSDLETSRAHVAFVSPSRAAVDRFFEQATAAGRHPRSPPALRPQYHAEYYSAHVLDPDGNDIEGVHHGSRPFPQAPEQETWTAWAR